MDLYDLRKLPKAGASLEEPLPKEWLAEKLNEPGSARTDEMALVPLEPGMLELKIAKMDRSETPRPVVRLRGRASASVRTSCVRCLEELRLELSAPIDLTLFPDGQGAKDPEKAEEAEVPRESLSQGTYQGFELDLEEIAREALILALDMNPSCGEQEACAARTKALLERAGVGPTKGETDPRWAALEKFRLKSSGQ